MPKPIVVPKSAPAPAPKPTLAQFVAKQVGPLGARAADFELFVESNGTWSATKPEPVRKPEPLAVKVTPPVKEDTRISSLSSQITQLQSDLANTKAALTAQHEAREAELLKRLEDAITAHMEAVLPKLTAGLKAAQHASTAKTLVAHMDFSKNSVDEVKNKLEDVIAAYEHRIETLGLTHFDLISERLQQQKAKWHAKLEALQRSFAEDLQKTAAERDEEWREALSKELSAAEGHFAQQAELDRAHVRQQTELELALKHKQEIDDITSSLAKATDERLVLLNEILDRLKEMEKIQEDHVHIIEKLKQVHHLHVTVESLQRTLTQDHGSLTADIEALKAIARKDEVVAAALASLADVYPSMVERGVPTVGQLLAHFREAKERARLAALVSGKSFWAYLNARLAYFLLPRAIGVVDEHDTFSLLESAEAKLQRGDLRQTATLLRQLQGYPREEVEAWLRDAGIRLALAGVLEALAEDAVGLVNDITKKQRSN